MRACSCRGVPFPHATSVGKVTRRANVCFDWAPYDAVFRDGAARLSTAA